MNMTIICNKTYMILYVIVSIEENMTILFPTIVWEKCNYLMCTPYVKSVAILCDNCIEQLIVPIKCEKCAKPMGNYMWVYVTILYGKMHVTTICGNVITICNNYLWKLYVQIFENNMI